MGPIEVADPSESKDSEGRIAVLEPNGESSGAAALLAPEAERQTPLSPEAAPRRGRLLSLDVFRGIAVGGMLLVNNKALGPWTPSHLTHAGWNEGVHFADLVYPWFLLIVGVAIPFSSRTWLPLLPYLYEVLKRAAALVLLGCLVNSSYARRPMFDLGVLQLIGLAYLGGALLYRVPLRPRLAIAAGLLVGHWALVRFLPIPGAGVGVFSREQNAIAYLNQAYLARWELENLPAILTTTALVVIGAGLGDLLRMESAGPRRKVGMLLAIGLGLFLAGWLWSADVPLNKRLWTSPYILLTAGWGAALLGLLYFVVDARGFRAWVFPLVVMGRNAITAFVAPTLVNIYILGGWGWSLPGGRFESLQEAWVKLFTGPLGAGLGGLLYTLSYLVAWWLVLFWMYRRKVFLRV